MSLEGPLHSPEQRQRDLPFLASLAILAATILGRGVTHLLLLSLLLISGLVSEEEKS